MTFKEKLIDDAGKYVEEFFKGESSGHDLYHSMRVCSTAVALAEREGADVFIVSLAALLHDVDDRKLSPETHETLANARGFLRSHGADEETVSKISGIISSVSFAGTDSVVPDSLEGACVQDADRLDALGAIGIARTFAYGGSRGRALYEPSVSPQTGMNGEEYKNSNSNSVNHFYEKLFLLKDMMNTRTGREIAEKRDSFMHEYLYEFLREWNGEDIK